MIASLRRRHRWMMAGLTAGLPILLAAALIDRPQMPGDGLPGELDVHTPEAPLVTGDAAFSSHRATVTRYATALGFKLGSALRAPDVLAYASASQADPSTGLPSDARLLGAVDPARTNLYPVDAGESGHLVLYSLGHQQVVDSAAFDAVAGYAPAPAASEDEVPAAEGTLDGAPAGADPAGSTAPDADTGGAA
ncbi:MAG: hypothetical protein AAGM22_11045 [Acidobacteriota bacterium]